jgi:mannosyltransferase
VLTLANRKFYDVPALKRYKWYWRVEPDVEFSCAMTYDPFVQMEKHGKVYGYTVALWEVDNTVPTLFRAVSDFKEAKRIRTTNLWRSMVKPSWIPRPIRAMWSSEPWRDAEGDEWNLCHYWSNFEIADLDFYRSKEYREFFEFLDRRGGFYFERVSKIFTQALYSACRDPQLLIEMAVGRRLCACTSCCSAFGA